jgi:hypothetical protein
VELHLTSVKEGSDEENGMGMHSAGRRAMVCEGRRRAVHEGSIAYTTGCSSYSGESIDKPSLGLL